MYKNYIFDLYGTLIDLKIDEKRDEFWYKLALFFSYNGATYEKNELKQEYLRIIDSKLEKRFEKSDHPDVKLIKIFKKLYKAKELKADKNLLLQTMRIFRILSTENIKLYDNVIETLKELKKAGKNLYILSNGQREFSLDELNYLGIINFFDALYFSSDYGICKPDAKFYERLIKKEGLDIKETLLIGNSYLSDIITAKNLGLSTLYLHTNLSPMLVDDLDSDYSIMDGDFKKILEINSKIKETEKMEETDE